MHSELDRFTVNARRWRTRLGHIFPSLILGKKNIFVLPSWRLACRLFYDILTWILSHQIVWPVETWSPQNLWRCGIWHQDVSGRSFKSCKLPGESVVDQTHARLDCNLGNIEADLAHKSGKKKNTYIRLPHQDCSFGDALTWGQNVLRNISHLLTGAM